MTSGAGIIDTVLVVDDDPVVLGGMNRTLGGRFRVRTATSIRSALENIAEVVPDLAVVDLRLGNEVALELVRTLAACSATFVVVLSGYLSVDMTVAVVNAGARIVIPKPVAPREIIERVLSGRAGTPALETPSLATAERDHIQRVIADCDGNLAEAARRLRICRSTLQRKLQKM